MPPKEARYSDVKRYESELNILYAARVQYQEKDDCTSPARTLIPHRGNENGPCAVGFGGGQAWRYRENGPKWIDANGTLKYSLTASVRFISDDE